MDDFALTDQWGRPFTRERLEGRWTFVLFADKRCTEDCAAALSALAGMCRRIARTRAIETTQVLFVSLDPERDTPDKLRPYLASFDDRFVGASGPRRALLHMADDLGVLESSPPASDPVASESIRYPVMLVLLNPDAVIWGQFLPPYDVLALTARYLKTRIGR